MFHPSSIKHKGSQPHGQSESQPYVQIGVGMISVRVPATSANLGPGFDCMGLALDLWNQFDLFPLRAGQPIVVETIGEGAGHFPCDQSHAVAQTMLAELSRLRGQNAQRDLAPSFRLICHNSVPAGSGLGSSSTVVLGGLLLAHAYAHMQASPDANSHDPLHDSLSVTSTFDHTIDSDAVLRRAIELEGHGDNVAPAMLGGLVVVVADDGPLTIRQILTPPLRVVVCVPNYHFLTSTARSVLPNHIDKPDAIRNIGRAILVVEALRSGDFALLSQVMHDRIHEPYRLPAIPGALAAREAALQQGAAAVTLSGAGPGLIAFCVGNHASVGAAMVEAFAHAHLPARYWVLESTRVGTHYVQSAHRTGDS